MAAIPAPGQPRRAAPARALPDFNLNAQSHRDLSTELAKCQNIPTMENGAAILRAIEDLGQRFDRMESRLKAVCVPASLFLLMRASQADLFVPRRRDSNNIARLSNSMLVEADAELSSLRNVETNQPIDGFPGTPRGYAGLTGKSTFYQSSVDS